MKIQKRKDLNYVKKLLIQKQVRKLKNLNIFFIDETRIDTALNNNNESIRFSSKVKNQIIL